jgi:hypothetical protein
MRINIVLNLIVNASYLKPTAAGTSGLAHGLVFNPVFEADKDDKKT